MAADIDEVIKALAHPTRRHILDWLKDPRVHFPGQTHSHEMGVCAGQIDQRADISQSSMSAHLATLRRAGLITRQKSGTWHFFKRNEDAIQAFLKELARQL